MKEITNSMIKEFKIMKLGLDFAGYTVKRKDSLSFHHLIVAKRNCKQQGLGEGYYRWNGAILVQETSHDYLHKIERVDPEIFYLITSEMVDENIKGYLDIANLKRIHELLTCFEREHSGDYTSKGRILIKEEYTRRIKL